MAGYIRQSSFIDGDTITAALFNNEYNQLVNAFSNTSGHKHDGTTAEGPVIGLIGDAGETSPNNKVLIDTTNNYIEFYVEVSSAPVQQLYIADGAIIPVTDNDIDLGTSSLEFKDIYIDGTATIDTLTIDEAATVGTTLGVTGATTLSSTLAVTGTSTLTGNVTATNDLSVGGNLTVTGNATISGNLTFGDADTDSINLAAEIDSDIIPNTDGTYDLGSATKEWQDLYIDGTANIDSLVADTADINGGTIDGATIATSDITVGSGKTLDVSAGTLTLADDQISGDKVEGGTIAATTITTLTSTTGNITNVNATTVDSTNLEITNLKAKDGTAAGSIADSTGVVTLASSVLTTTDINGGTIDGSTIATSDITVGTGKTLDVSSGTLTLADNQISGNKVEGGTIAATTITDLTFGSLNDGTITITAFADEDDMSSDSATLVPTQQSVKAYVDSQVTAQDLDATTDSGTIAIDLDSETLTIAGGEGIDTSAATNTITIAGEDASTTNKGIASFSSDDFTVSSGAVSLATTSTAAELNILDGATVTTAELNILDGVTSTAAELNILDGVTSTAAELNILDGVTSTTAELNILDGVTSTAAELNILDGKAFLDEDNMASNSATGIASQQSIKAYVDSQVGAVSTDVVSDTTPQLGGDLDTNGNDIVFTDTDKAIFGSPGSDLQIYHSGTNSFITEAGTGSLFIDSDNTIHIRNVAGTSNMAQFTPGGAVSLYYANGLKLATTSTGIDVTGTAVTDGLTVAGTAQITNTSSIDTLTLAGNTGSVSGVKLQAEEVHGAMYGVNIGTNYGGLAFHTNNNGTVAEKVRIDNAGNVGIGISPTQRLDVSNVSRYTFNVDNAYTLQTSLNAAGSAVADSYINAAQHIFQTSATERMRLDSSGNLGIGLTPSYSASGRPSLEIGGSTQGNLAFNGSGKSGLIITNSAHNGSAFVAVNTGVSSAYSQESGEHRFFSAASVSAGAAQTFSEHMRIDSSGRVGIGTTSPQTDLNIVNTSGATLDINTNLAGADSKILLHEGSSSSPANGASIRYDGANNLFKIGVGSSVDTTRLTIARDSGNVGIGTTSPTEKLTVNGALAITGALSDDRTSTAAIDFSSGVSRVVSYGASGTAGITAFRTASGGASSAELMRILGTGEVHITSGGDAITPTTKHSGATGDVAKLRVINRSGQGADKGGLVELGAVTNDGVDRSDVLGSVAGLKTNGTSGDMQGYLQFSTNTGSALSEVMRINSSGQVGIGTTDAGNAKLVINGNTAAGDVACIDFDGFGSRGDGFSQSINFRMGRPGQATDQPAQIKSYFQGGGATAGQTSIGFKFTTISSNTQIDQFFIDAAYARFKFNSDENPQSNNPQTSACFVIGPSGSTAVTSGLTSSCVLLNRGGELYAVDSSHNNTQLTPHNWTLIPDGPSEELAWTYWSQRPNPDNPEQLQGINVDMAKVARKVEDLVGEKLVYTENSNMDDHTHQNIIADIQSTLADLTTRIEALEG